MTGSSLTHAPEVVTGPLRDEASLERLFRTQFSPLCAEAKEYLGEAAESAAPKVVESAFRQAYEDRVHIATEPELSTFLHDAVRRASARELSRRAGARHLGAGATGAAHHHATAVADVDQAWLHLTRQLHPETVRADAAAYTEQLRHHAAEHVGDLSKPRSWKLPVLLGVVAAALVAGAMWWLTQLGTDLAVTRALASSDARSLQAANGQTGNLTLADSTKVTLAPGSKLTIPKQFPNEMRAVKVDGAARFNVAPGQTQSFEIRAGDAAIVATGTTIVVRAYPNDKRVIVNLPEGSAKVKVGKDEMPMSAGQTLVVADHTMRQPTPEETAEATSWTTRRVVMSRQLRDVVAELNRFYGVDIKVPELKALDRPASIDAPLDSLRIAIAQVEQSSGLSFGYEGSTMLFRTKKTGADSTKK